MALHGPILCVEDDEDDQFLLRATLEELGISNPLLFFSNGIPVMEYLTSTSEEPFLILCDVNMPLMNGLELRQQMQQHTDLQKKFIPFIYLTTAANPTLVNQAYQGSIQGFYKKASDYSTFKEQLKTIVEYWQNCLLPGSTLR